MESEIVFLKEDAFYVEAKEYEMILTGVCH